MPPFSHLHLFLELRVTNNERQTTQFDTIIPLEIALPFSSLLARPTYWPLDTLDHCFA